MHPVFAPQLKKPSGLFGLYAARFMVKRNAFVYPAIESYAGFESGQSVLEIGFGPGESLRYFLDRHDIRVDGVDISPLMLRRAARRNRKAMRAGRLRLFLGDIREDHPRIGRYDRVVFSNVLYFWDDLEAAFRAVKARVKSGGKLVFYMSNKSRLERNPLTSVPVFNHYSRADVLGSLARSGFVRAAAHSIVDDSGDMLIIEAEA